MPTIINMAEIGRILFTQQPADKFEALALFFNREFSIDISTLLFQISDSIKTEETGAEEPLLPEDFIDWGARTISKESMFEDMEDHTQSYSIIFEPNNMVIVQITSNKGNTWLVCIHDKPTAKGGAKYIHPIQWLVSIKDEIPTYKERNIANKYLLVLFNPDMLRTLGLPYIREEVKKNIALDPHTKRLFHLEEAGIFGTVMHNYGPDLVDIFTNLDPKDEDDVETIFLIASLLAEKLGSELKLGYTHGDLKPENICFNGKILRFIDQGDRHSINETLNIKSPQEMQALSLKFKGKIPDPKTKCFMTTSSYSKSDFLDNIKLLNHGEYRIIHDLWAFLLLENLILECNVNIVPKTFFEAKFSQIESLFKEIQTHQDKLGTEVLIKLVRNRALEFMDQYSKDLKALKEAKLPAQCLHPQDDLNALEETAMLSVSEEESSLFASSSSSGDEESLSRSVSPPAPLSSEKNDQVSKHGIPQEKTDESTDSEQSKEKENPNSPFFECKKRKKTAESPSPKKHPVVVMGIFATPTKNKRRKQNNEEIISLYRPPHYLYNHLG